MKTGNTILLPFEVFANDPKDHLNVHYTILQNLHVAQIITLDAH